MTAIPYHQKPLRILTGSFLVGVYVAVVAALAIGFAIGCLVGQFCLPCVHP